MATTRHRVAARGPTVAVVVALLLGQMAVAMVTAAVRQAPTIDEPVYVGTAAVHLEERGLRYGPGHPPLGNPVVAAVYGSRDFGTRYAVFPPMFLAVAAGCVLVVRRRWVVAPTTLLVAFVAVSPPRTFPLCLPYSGEAFGGPSKARFRPHDSNVDRGQDLGRLADRLRERYRGERIRLVHKGGGVPSYYRVDAAGPRRVPPAEVRGVPVASGSAAARATGRPS